GGPGRNAGDDDQEFEQGEGGTFSARGLSCLQQATNYLRSSEPDGPVLVLTLLRTGMSARRLLEKRHEAASGLHTWANAYQHGPGSGSMNREAGGPDARLPRRVRDKSLTGDDDCVR